MKSTFFLDRLAFLFLDVYFFTDSSVMFPVLTARYLRAQKCLPQKSFRKCGYS